MIQITNQQGETFTFDKGMIETNSANFETGVDQMRMPISGPLNNQGFDIDGNGKVISLRGRFFDTKTSVTDINNIRSMKIMKYWFEAVLSGNQIPVIFKSWMDEFSVRGAGSTTFTDEVSGETVTLNADFDTTTVYLIGFQCDDDEGNVETLPFTMNLWVGGV